MIILDSEILALQPRNNFEKYPYLYADFLDRLTADTWKTYFKEIARLQTTDQQEARTIQHNQNADSRKRIIDIVKPCHC